MVLTYIPLKAEKSCWEDKSARVPRLRKQGRHVYLATPMSHRGIIRCTRQQCHWPRAYSL